MKKTNVFDEGLTMKCPFRRKESYKYQPIDPRTPGRVVVAEVIEEYPDCYQYECPYFSAPSSCERTNPEY